MRMRFILEIKNSAETSLELRYSYAQAGVEHMVSVLLNLLSLNFTRPFLQTLFGCSRAGFLTSMRLSSRSEEGPAWHDVQLAVELLVGYQRCLITASAGNHRFVPCLEVLRLPANSCCRDKMCACFLNSSCIALSKLTVSQLLPILQDPVRNNVTKRSKYAIDQSLR